MPTLFREATERAPRVGAALRLQVAWMRHSILKLQREHSLQGKGLLEAMMPGLFGYESATYETHRPSSRSAVPTPRASTSGVVAALAAAAPQPPAPTISAVDAAALAQLEGERAKLVSKDAAMEAQMAAIDAALEKLSGDMHSA